MDAPGGKRPLATRVLMCAPTHFEVRYAINPWMSQVGSGRVDSLRAMRQWQALVVAVRRRCGVDMVDAAPNAPDMCFTANAGLVHGVDFVRSNFLHVERRVEERPFASWFATHGFTSHALPRDVSFEGAGDALFDASRELLWMGHGFRSDPRAAAHLEDILGVAVAALRLVDPRFYHLDTCFCPLANGCLVYYPGAFDAKANAVIEDMFQPGSRIAIDEADALRFACNMIDLGREVLVAGASESLKQRLAAKDVRTVVVELDEFIKAGGGAKCLALPYARLAARFERVPA